MVADMKNEGTELKNTEKADVTNTKPKVAKIKTVVKKVAVKEAPKVVAKVKKIALKPKKEEPKIKVNVYGIDGKIDKEIELPRVFNTEFRPDLIRRAVKAMRANRRQKYGPTPRSGFRRSTSWWGKGRGVSRSQRVVNSRRGAQSPEAVGGRRAWPPQLEKNYGEKINKKEKLKAKISALSATKDKEMVSKRGHKFVDDLTLPVVVSEKFEELKTTKKVAEVLDKIGVYDDIERAIKGKHVRAGKGKNRGRRYKVPKSLLIVVSDGAAVSKSAQNLLGVDVVTPKGLNVEHLAPGGDAGRLLVISEKALETMKEW